MATITTEDIRALADDLRFRADAAPGGSGRGRTLETLAFALTDMATRAEQRADGTAGIAQWPTMHDPPRCPLCGGIREHEDAEHCFDCAAGWEAERA